MVLSEYEQLLRAVNAGHTPTLTLWLSLHSVRLFGSVSMSAVVLAVGRLSWSLQRGTASNLPVAVIISLTAQSSQSAAAH